MDEGILDKALAEDWYYTIELKPGLFTKGRNHNNIATTRTVLRATDVSNKTCIDIGTMEGLVPVLLKRRGACFVAAQDITDRQQRIDIVKSMLNVDFNYYGGLKLSDLRPTLKKTGHFPLDVTVFSGVLYHMLDPFAGLAVARSLVRDGGILIVETLAAVHSEMVLFFNAEGKLLKDPTTFFIISTALLDYMLCLLRLRPLDCIYIEPYLSAGIPMTRICVPCRAVDERVQWEGDDWVPRQMFFDEYLDWQELKQNAPPVVYKPVNQNIITRKDTGTVDIFRTIQNGRNQQTRPPDELMRLRLNDLY